MERKLATVLFVDLVDSTMLVADADPEVVRRRVSSFFDQVSRCIVTHGGTVEKFAGDAVMAAFGVPLAHEDDAERAVRAAIATLERVKELGLETIHPLELRGWREPVAAQRVICVNEPGEPVTGLSAPLVGRESELELL